MKKFLSFCAAMFIALAVNAGTYQIVGDLTGWSTPADMSLVSENLYMAQFTLKQYGEIPFQPIINGAWNNYNASLISAHPGLTISESTDGYHNFAVTLPVGSVYYVVKFYLDVTNPGSEKMYVTADLDSSTNVFSVMGDAALGLEAGDPASATDNMTYGGDGKFYYLKENVTLAAGTGYWYKVIGNHSWDPSYGDPDDEPYHNKYISVPEAGAYDIYFSFDWNTKAVSAFAILRSDDVKVAGDFEGDTEGWEQVVLTRSLDRMTATGSVVLGESKLGLQGMKVVIGNTWKTIEDRGNRITRKYHENWAFTSYDAGEGSNAPIELDMAGTYSFTFSFVSQELTITYPSTFVRHFDNAYYSTICLPQDAELENAYAYTVTSVAGHQITLSDPVANLSAGVPYIIKPSAANVDVTATLSGDVVANGDPGVGVGDNGMWGTLAIGGVDSVSNGNYILSENQFHLVQLTQGSGKVSVPRFRGALYSSVVLAPSLRIIEAENGATNIQNVEGNEAAVKFIENGKVLILREGVVYDMTGRVVR